MKKIKQRSEFHQHSTIGALDRVTAPDNRAYDAIPDADNRLNKLCMEKIQNIYPKEKLLQSRIRLFEELDSIKQHGYAATYLYWYEIIQRGQLKKYQYSARGTAPGSIICYLLGISHVDPLDEEVPLYYEFFQGYDGEREPFLELNVDENVYLQVIDVANNLPGVHIPIQPGPNYVRRPTVGCNILSNKICALISRMEELTGDCFSDEVTRDEAFIHSFLSQEKQGISLFSRPDMPQLLEKLQPRTYAELIKVLGLLCGTGVWEHNGEILLADGKADLTSLISNREDVFDMLLAWGMERRKAFEAAENVRKGMMYTGKMAHELREEMFLSGAPAWFIWSCDRIQYLFPRAHCAELIQMEFRCFYYKDRYPETYAQTYQDIFVQE